MLTCWDVKSEGTGAGVQALYAEASCDALTADAAAAASCSVLLRMLFRAVRASIPRTSLPTGGFVVSAVANTSSSRCEVSTPPSRMVLRLYVADPMGLPVAAFDSLKTMDPRPGDASGAMAAAIRAPLGVPTRAANAASNQTTTAWQ